MTTTAVLAALVLAANGADGRLLDDDVSAGLGVLGSGYAVHGARWGDALFTPTLTGRGVFGGFVVDGGLLVATPLAPGGTSFSTSVGLRVGWSGQRWALVGGAVLQWAHDGRPALQLVPTLRGSVDLGAMGLTLGVLDDQGMVPAHLSADLPTKLGRFSLGWVFPIGLIGSADVPISGRVGLRVSGFVFRVFNAEVAMLTVAATWGSR